MRRSILAALLIVTVVACDDDETGPQAEVFTAALSGAKENPPNSSTASGTAKVTINTNRTLTVDLAVTGMTGTISGHHIHGPATTTQNAGVILGLALGVGQTFTPANFTGAVSFDSALVLIRNGLAYVNIHSTPTFPGGEIRGQLTRQ